MPCYKPLEGWYSKELNPSGKRSLVFTPSNALQPDDPLEIPCGQCVGCRLDRSKEWAIRCVHEASLHENNSFITLTFNEDSLNKRENPNSLDKTEFQKFIKRLRKEVVPKNPYPTSQKNKRADWQFKNGIRYFHCGEYGDQYKRPHYHAILFGFDFPDKELLDTINGQHLYRSNLLEKLWPYGYSSIGNVTFESAAYVARYVLKKITGDLAWQHYSDIDYETGEITNVRQPEYTTMSRRPGIASKWFEKYNKDCFPSDFITHDGRKLSIPKYYDKLLEKENPHQLADIKEERAFKANKHWENNTRERLKIRELIQLKKLKQLPRNIDKCQN
jgi:hypothetical protein